MSHVEGRVDHLHPDGSRTTYAVDETADEWSAEEGWHPMTEIALDDPGLPGLKVSERDVVKQGEANLRGGGLARGAPADPRTKTSTNWATYSGRTGEPVKIGSCSTAPTNIWMASTGSTSARSSPRSAARRNTTATSSARTRQ